MSCADGRKKRQTHLPPKMTAEAAGVSGDKSRS